MRFREAVFAKAFNLGKDPLSKLTGVAAHEHAVDDLVVEWPQAAAPSPGGHGPPELIGLARCEACSQNGQLHDLLLKDGHAQGSCQCGLHGRAWIVDGLQALASSQVGVNHAPLNGPGPNNGHLDDEVVEAGRLEPRQHAHLCA